jgi:hypothetical protein
MGLTDGWGSGFLSRLGAQCCPCGFPVNSKSHQLTSRCARGKFMVVTTQENGREVPGLRVGAANVRKYFPRDMGAVELLLGDLRIECSLPPNFWNGQPEIRDPRLGAWLKFKVLRARSNRKPIALAMERAGANAFTLRSMPYLPQRAAAPKRVAGRMAVAV